MNRSHIASNKYFIVLPKGLVQRMTTFAIHDSIRHKVHKKTKKLFLYFYQTVGV